MNWESLLNLALLAQGCYLVGVSSVVMAHYWRDKRRKPRLFQHILCVVISYMILTARGIYAIYKGYTPVNDPWLYALIVAFALGDFALLRVVQRQYRPNGEGGGRAGG